MSTQQRIRDSLDVLYAPGDVVELRILNAGRDGTVSGYFDDFEKLAYVAGEWDGNAAAVYVTLNPVNRSLLARANNRAIARAKVTTSDNDITHRRWFPIDLDAVRPSGISSTDEEHEAAKARGREVWKFLRDVGWPGPLGGDSGNGAHLLYRIDLPNDAESLGLIRGCLEALAFRFTDDAVTLDTSVSNAARVWKLYGTTAAKGENLPERPHRQSKLLKVPDKLTPVSREQLKQLAATKPQPESRSDGGGSRLDLESWIRDHDLQLAFDAPWQGGHKWILETCPWNAEHTNRSAFILQFPSGAPWAGCHHNGCQGRGWTELRELLEPGYRKTLRGDEADTREHRVEVVADDDDDTDDVDDAEHRPLELPRSALRGSFSNIIEYTRPVTGANPAHVFAAWWSAVGVSIGSARWGSWSGRVVSVVYALKLGPTGDHKTTAGDLVVDLLPESVNRVDGVTSDAGLFDTIESADGPVILHYDELGFLLKMSGMTSSTLEAMLNRLWSAPQFLDRNLSKRSKDGGARRIERPFVCLLGGTHPETFWRTLADPTLAISSGFVNRIAMFVVEQARSLSVTAEPDSEAAADLRGHLKRLTFLEPSRVDLAPKALALWRDFAVDQDERVQGLPVDLASVTKRVRDHVARLALTFAVDAGRTTVQIDDMLAAVEVGAYLEACYRRLLLGRQADRGPARTSSLETIGRRILASRPGVWHTARQVIHAWPNASRPSSEEIRRVLRAMDGVEIDPAQSRRKERYRLLRKAVHNITTHNPAKKQGVVCCEAPPCLARGFSGGCGSGMGRILPARTTRLGWKRVRS